MGYRVSHWKRWKPDSSVQHAGFGLLLGPVNQVNELYLAQAFCFQLQALPKGATPVDEWCGIFTRLIAWGRIW
jgi:hypothetical protein